MNIFAIAVIVLQVCAAVQYIYDRKYDDALIWFLYGVINVVIVWKACK